VKTAVLIALWLLPILGAIFVRALSRSELARRVALTLLVLVFGMSIVVLASTEPQSLTHQSPALRAIAVNGLGVDGLSAVLLPLVAALGITVLVAAPRRDLDAEMVSDLLLVVGATLGTLVSTNVVVLVVYWALSLTPLRNAAGRSGAATVRSAVDFATIGSVLPMVIGIGGRAFVAWQAHLGSPLDIGALAVSRHSVGPMEPVFGGLVIAAVWVRMGMFPFHAWFAHVAEKGATPLVIPALASPLGSFVFARLGFALFPEVCEALEPLLLALASATAAYGSFLTLGQHALRRQIGYLLISLNGFVVVGLAARNAQSMSGALLHDVAAVVSCAGLLLLAWGIEARAGTSDMRRLGGLVQTAPRMAAGFLMLALALVGLPGTVTFVSEDLLFQGVLHDHSQITAVLAVCSAVNGISLVRSFKRIFLGPPTPQAPDLRRFQDLLPRERWAAVALVVSLLAVGLAPTPVLAIRHGVVESLRRTEMALTPAPHAAPDTLR
jgi:NADH-quinone oxidoreductase subunit M